MIENERFLQIRKMSPNEVGKKIAHHCKGSELIFTVKVTKDNIEKVALRTVKAMKCKYDTGCIKPH